MGGVKNRVGAIPTYCITGELSALIKTMVGAFSLSAKFTLNLVSKNRSDCYCLTIGEGYQSAKVSTSQKKWKEQLLLSIKRGKPSSGSKPRGSRALALLNANLRSNGSL